MCDASSPPPVPWPRRPTILGGGARSRGARKGRSRLWCNVWSSFGGGEGVGTFLGGSGRERRMATLGDRRAKAHVDPPRRASGAGAGEVLAHQPLAPYGLPGLTRRRARSALLWRLLGRRGSVFRADPVMPAPVPHNAPSPCLALLAAAFGQARFWTCTLRRAREEVTSGVQATVAACGGAWPPCGSRPSSHPGVPGVRHAIAEIALAARPILRAGGEGGRAMGADRPARRPRPRGQLPDRPALQSAQSRESLHAHGSAVHVGMPTAWSPTGPRVFLTRDWCKTRGEKTAARPTGRTFHHAALRRPGKRLRPHGRLALARGPLA